MKYLNSALLLLSTFLLFSCSSDIKKDSVQYPAETQRFNTYLQKNFSASIPPDSTCYVLISSTGCGGCIKSFLDALTIKSGSSNVHYILSGKLLARESKDPAEFSSQVMIDEENQVDRLPYHKGNIAILETAEGKIYNYYNVEPYQTDSVLLKINKQ
jgi:hypothetical protein